MIRLCGLAALIFLGYGIAASATQFLFLATYGAAALPSVWAAVGLVSLAAVGRLSVLLRRAAVPQVLADVSLRSAAAFALLLAATHWQVPAAVYALFVYKDVYIVQQSELFWSLANHEFPQRRAFAVYGLFCAAGSLSGMAGNLLAGPLSVRLGVSSLQCLWAVVPLCLATGWMTRHCAGHLRRSTQAPPGGAVLPLSPRAVGEALRVVTGSRLLPLLLGMVLLTQMSVTVVDYEFNRALLRHFVDEASQRRALGIVYSIVNALSVALQLLTGPLLRLLGLRATLLGVPLSVLLCSSLSLGVPGFGSISLLKIWGKSMDYSLFRTAKEFLYIPLGYRERTEGKAIIDMLVYRLAKAPAAALLWLLTVCCHEAALGWLQVLLCLLWLGLAQVILHRRAEAAACDDTD